MDGIAVKPLTVDFHETPFLTKLNGENQLGFWFQLSDQERQQAGSPWGPSNPQALNRYSYVLNNPLKWIDPTGHAIYLNKSQAADLLEVLDQLIPMLEEARKFDVRVYNMYVNTALTTAGAVFSPAISFLFALGGGFLTPFLDHEGTDHHGNYELLKTLRQLAGVIETYIDEVGANDILSIYMIREQIKMPPGYGLRRYVVEHRLVASWGGKRRMNVLLDKTVEQWAQQTGRDREPADHRRGPR